MTVKTQGGKVITKDGKVSCSCCETPDPCCMYAAQLIANGTHTASDLPDAVTIGGVSYSRSGTSYGNTANGVLYEDGVWARYTNGVRNERACLIQGGVVDQFSSSYVVEGLLYNVTVPRFSLCFWQEIVCDLFATSYQAVVKYNAFKGKWEAEVIDFFIDVGPDGQPECFDSGFTVFGEKLGSQNSPVGDYLDENEFFEEGMIFTVSEV